MPIQRRIVFMPPVEKESEIEINNYSAFLLQNAGNCFARLDRNWQLMPEDDFHAMRLKDGEAYRQKIHISFGDMNISDPENPTELGIIKRVNWAVII